MCCVLCVCKTALGSKECCAELEKRQAQKGKGKIDDDQSDFRFKVAEVKAFRRQYSNVVVMVVVVPLFNSKTPMTN